MEIDIEQEHKEAGELARKIFEILPHDKPARMVSFALMQAAAIVISNMSATSRKMAPERLQALIMLFEKEKKSCASNQNNSH